MEHDDIHYWMTGWPNSAYDGILTHPKDITKQYLDYKNFEPSSGNRNTKDPIKVMSVTWNTEYINICALNKDDKWYGTKTILGKEQCYIPRFMGSLFKGALDQEYDLIVINLQESAKPGDYLLSYTLPYYLDKKGYVLLAREKLIGTGVSAVKGKLLRGLRLGVFARKKWYKGLSVPPKLKIDKVTCPTFKHKLVQGKGGISISLSIQGYGKITFIDTHMPFWSKRLNYKTNPNDIKDAIEEQTSCFNHVFNELSDDSDYVILSGDLNFRIIGMNPHQAFQENGILKQKNELSTYKVYDELKQLMDAKKIEKMLEGLPEFIGPNFPFTCKMKKGRDNSKKKREPVKEGFFIWNAGYKTSELVRSYPLHNTKRKEKWN